MYRALKKFPNFFCFGKDANIEKVKECFNNKIEFLDKVDQIENTERGFVRRLINQYP